MFSDDEDDFHDAVTDPDYAQFSVSCPPPKHKRSGSSVSGCRFVLFQPSLCPRLGLPVPGEKLSWRNCQRVKMLRLSCHLLKSVVYTAQEVTE